VSEWVALDCDQPFFHYYERISLTYVRIAGVKFLGERTTGEG